MINGLSKKTHLEFVEVLGKVAEEIFQAGFEVGKAHNSDGLRVKHFIHDELHKSPNQQRAELIQRAREFVEENTVLPFVFRNGVECLAARGWYLVPSFIVNHEKRTVVCLLKSAGRQVVKFKGIAKCKPGEVFNGDIGKAIALARALEIEVPQEFMYAIQPDEVVEGMNVYCDDSCYFTARNGVHMVKRAGVSAAGGQGVFVSARYNHGRKDGLTFVHLNRLNIIDDSNAQYEEVAQ